MLDGFRNIEKRDGAATLMWVNDDTNEALITFAEDSGYNSNMIDRITALAADRAAKFCDMRTREIKLGNLPPFDPKNYILVKVQIVGAKQLQEKPQPAEHVDPEIITTPSEPQGAPVKHSKSMLAVMNRDALLGVLGTYNVQLVDSATKADMVAEILRLQEG